MSSPGRGQMNGGREQHCQILWIGQRRCVPWDLAIWSSLVALVGVVLVELLEWKHKWSMFERNWEEGNWGQKLHVASLRSREMKWELQREVGSGKGFLKLVNKAKYRMFMWWQTDPLRWEGYLMEEKERGELLEQWPWVDKCRWHSQLTWKGWPQKHW